MKLNGDIKMKSLATKNADRPTHRIPSLSILRNLIRSFTAQTDPEHHQMHSFIGAFPSISTLGHLKLCYRLFVSFKLILMKLIYCFFDSLVGSI